MTGQFPYLEPDPPERFCALPGCDNSLKGKRPNAVYCSTEHRAEAYRHGTEIDPVARFYAAASKLRRCRTFAKHRVARPDAARNRSEG